MVELVEDPVEGHGKEGGGLRSGVNGDAALTDDRDMSVLGW